MISAFVDHVWQSTLFAFLAWALASLLRRNGAHLRFWVWFAASLKFLVPFALLATVGSQLGDLLFTPVAVPTSFSALQQAAAPVLLPATHFNSHGSEGISLLGTSILAAWGIGFVVLVARWLARWLEVRAILRSAIPSDLVAPIPVLCSSTLHEPGVVGIFRPVLLLPEKLSAQLNPQQLHAILEHELCHVRRRDNLTTAIHMLVEALFWFHPLVWWIGARLLSERERACDETVVRFGHEPEAYAEGILKVCRLFLASKLTCVSGVSGADLKTRLEIIMRKDAIADLSRSKRLLLSLTALASLAAPILIGITAPSPVQSREADNSGIKIQLLEGKRVKLQYQEVEVRALLRALAEAARVNVLVSDKVTGTVSMNLAEMPWDQALTIILHAHGLVKHEKDGIIFIEPAPASAGA